MLGSRGFVSRFGRNNDVATASQIRCKEPKRILSLPSCSLLVSSISHHGIATTLGTTPHTSARTYLAKLQSDELLTRRCDRFITARLMLMSWRRTFDLVHAQYNAILGWGMFRLFLDRPVQYDYDSPRSIKFEGLWPQTTLATSQRASLPTRNFKECATPTDSMQIVLASGQYLHQLDPGFDMCKNARRTAFGHPMSTGRIRISAACLLVFLSLGDEGE